MVAEVERRRSRRTTRPVRRRPARPSRRAGLVVGPVVHRVVGDVDDVVAAGGPVGQDCRHAGHGVRAAIDDAVEVDEEQQTHAADRSRASSRAYDGLDARPRPRPARRHRSDAHRWDEPPPHDDKNGRCSTSGGAGRPAAGRDPGTHRDRARLRRTGRARAARRTDRVRDHRPIQRPAHRRCADPFDGRWRPEGRRRRRHRGAPGHHRRPRSSPRCAASRRAHGGLEMAARQARIGSRAGRIDRQSAATPTRRAVERTAMRDDRAGWKPGRGATTKRGNPRKAPRTGGAGRMPP